MSSDSNKISSPPNGFENESIGEEYIAIQDETGDALKVAILNENDPVQWIEAVPDYAYNLEDMR